MSSILVFPLDTPICKLQQKIQMKPITYHAMGKFRKPQIDDIFLIYPQK